MKNLVILLVDDDLQLLEATEYVLRYEGYDVITCKNGQEAVDRYMEIMPKLTLMDMRMPILDGYEAFLRIIKMHSKANIVFTSLYTINDEQFNSAKKLGLKGSLTKPFDMKKLDKLINSL